MNRDRGILSAVTYPITRTSNISEWRDESAAMPRWRDEGAAMPQWCEDEDVPARQFDASDEWDDKWLRPLLIKPPSHVPPSQVTNAESAPEKCVVEAPAGRADASTECDARWLRSLLIKPPSHVPTLQPATAESAPEKCVVEAPAKRADESAERDAEQLRHKFAAVPPSQVPPSAPKKAANHWEPMEPEAMPLKLRFLRWLFRVNQCRAKRYSTPDLVAYYFTGGAPHSFQVGDISASGLYLLTPERWTLGTLIQMTLHMKDGSSGSPKDSIRVLSELVRFDENGAGFSFVLPDYEYLCAYGLRPEEVLDRKSIERFMRKIRGRAG
jgi:hypothetical protein